METSLRALGIDFGERRIGLAISDPAGRLAVPLLTLERRSDRIAVAQIAEIAGREGVLQLVVGEPVSVDGSRGEAAERVRRFGAKLALRTGLPLTFVGEALTTVEAHARLREAGVDPRREPGRLDALAAQILLQEALDRAPEHGDILKSRTVDWLRGAPEGGRPQIQNDPAPAPAPEEPE